MDIKTIEIIINNKPVLLGVPTEDEKQLIEKLLKDLKNI